MHAPASSEEQDEGLAQVEELAVQPWTRTERSSVVCPFTLYIYATAMAATCAHSAARGCPAWNGAGSQRLGPRRPRPSNPLMRVVFDSCKGPDRDWWGFLSLVV